MDSGDRFYILFHSDDCLQRSPRNGRCTYNPLCGTYNQLILYRSKRNACLGSICGFWRGWLHSRSRVRRTPLFVTRMAVHLPVTSHCQCPVRHTWFLSLSFHVHKKRSQTRNGLFGCVSFNCWTYANSRLCYPVVVSISRQRYLSLSSSYCLLFYLSHSCSMRTRSATRSCHHHCGRSAILQARGFADSVCPTLFHRSYYVCYAESLLLTSDFIHVYSRQWQLPDSSILYRTHVSTSRQFFSTGYGDSIHTFRVARLCRNPCYNKSH